MVKLKIPGPREEKVDWIAIGLAIIVVFIIFEVFWYRAFAGEPIPVLKWLYSTFGVVAGFVIFWFFGNILYTLVAWRATKIWPLRAGIWLAFWIVADAFGWFVFPSPSPTLLWSLCCGLPELGATVLIYLVLKHINVALRVRLKAAGILRRH